MLHTICHVHARIQNLHTFYNEKTEFFWEGSISHKIFTNQYFKIDQQIHKILKFYYSMQFDIV